MVKKGSPFLSAERRPQKRSQNATTYRVEGELREWIRDYAKEQGIGQTELVVRILEAERAKRGEGKA